MIVKDTLDGKAAGFNATKLSCTRIELSARRVSKTRI